MYGGCYISAKFRRLDYICFTTSIICSTVHRPLLIGTTSVRESEAVLDVLQRFTDPERYGLHLESVQMLNAKPDKV